MVVYIRPAARWASPLTAFQLLLASPQLARQPDGMRDGAGGHRSYFVDAATRSVADAQPRMALHIGNEGYATDVETTETGEGP